jgi:hypothetical protein
MQPVFDELELVTRTRFSKRVEIVQNLAHGCMMTLQMTLGLGLSCAIALASWPLSYGRCNPFLMNQSLLLAPGSQ